MEKEFFIQFHGRERISRNILYVFRAYFSLKQQTHCLPQEQNYCFPKDYGRDSYFVSPRSHTRVLVFRLFPRFG